MTDPVCTLHATRMVEMVSRNQTNHYGALFGDHALRLADMAAFVTASRQARRPVVTAEFGTR